MKCLSQIAGKEPNSCLTDKIMHVQQINKLVIWYCWLQHLLTFMKDVVYDYVTSTDTGKLETPSWKIQVLGLMKIGNHRKIGELTPTSIVDLPHLVLFSLDSVPGAQGLQK